MKIILSRKGFDSSTGKKPSFIGPNGELVSLPIPSRVNALHSTTYQNITSPIGSLGTVLQHVKARGRGKPSQRLLGHHLAHLDPDLSQNSIARGGNWVGAFGQSTSGAAQILIDYKVGQGDLFLFFGWFKQQSQTFPDRPYQRGEPNLHVVFGYLQVEDVYDCTQIAKLLQKYPGLRTHPHVYAPHKNDPNNRIYIGKQALSIDGISSRPGWGIFKYNANRVLTRKDKFGNWETRSHWLLRDIGKNSNAEPPFVRRAGKFMNWQRVGCDWEVTDFGRGQEFIIDSSFPGALPWACSFF
jgi:hypothetical protein